MKYPELNEYKDVKMLEGEVWKPLVGLEDLYEISNLGRVKRLKTEIQSKNQHGSFSHTLEEKILTVHPDSSGYPTVVIGEGKSRYKKNYRVHRLVAAHFLNKIEGCNIVHHKDNDKMNPFYSNLEWTTLEGNQTYAYEDGCKKMPAGEDSCVSKHKRDRVAIAYLMAKSGITSQEKIGELLGLPQITVSNIKTKKTWQELTNVLDEYCY